MTGMKNMFESSKQFAKKWHRPIEFSLFVIGFIIATIAFLFDLSERQEQRLVSGWHLLAERAPGASGKKRAINYLLTNNESLVAINLSHKRHGAPVYLMALDVYDENENKGADFRLSSFAGAIMRDSDLRKSDFSFSCLRNAELGGALFHDSKFNNADLTRANLWEADLSGADFSGAILSETHMERSVGLTQQQIDVAIVLT